MPIKLNDVVQVTDEKSLYLNQIGQVVDIQDDLYHLKFMDRPGYAWYREEDIAPVARPVGHVLPKEVSYSPQSPCGDHVNHPAHYNQGKHEVIDVIEDWGLGFHLGNAVKYIARAEHKEDKLVDLRKAIWYIEREVDRHEG